MNLKAKDYIKAIQTAESSSEVIRLWTEAARIEELTIQDIVEIHKVCGNILVEAVHKDGEEKEIKVEKEAAN